MTMTIKHVVMALVFLFIVVPFFANAQDRLSETYTKDEVDAKIGEVRSLCNAQSVSKAEIDTKFNALQSELKQLINGNERLNERVAASFEQRLDTLRADIVRPDRNEHGIGSLLSSLLAPMTGALITAAVLCWVHYHSLRLKKVESTLEFSKRFGELIQRQTELNRMYRQARPTEDNPPTSVETYEAKVWWWQFFDLVLYEYDFFRQGFLWDERFARWMRFRWHEYNAKGDDLWKTCGMDYRAGWDSWECRRANHNSRLSRFLAKVHNAKTESEVVQIVKDESPNPWKLRQSYHLD
jgi:hypothetical protein